MLCTVALWTNDLGSMSFGGILIIVILIDVNSLMIRYECLDSSRPESLIQIEFIFPKSYIVKSQIPIF